MRSIVVALCVCAGLCVTSLSAGPASAQAKRSPEATPGQSGKPVPGPSAPTIPGSGFNTARLKELARPKITPSERTQLGLRFLREEMKSPSPTDRGRTDGRSGHDWTMARIVEEMGKSALDRKILAEELKFSHSGEFQAALRILLVRADEKSQLTPLAGWLVERDPHVGAPFGWLRLQAVAALDPTRDRSVLEALWKTAASDPFAVPVPKVTDPKGKEAPGPGLTYPVRKRALEALAGWRSAGVPMSSYVVRTLDENRFEVRLPTPGK